MHKPTPYVYNAEVVSVYDGDSITVLLDLGMKMTVKASCRLFGLDTPEIRSKVAGEKEAANKAKDRVKSLVLGKNVVVQSVQKPDKYGRLLVKVWTEEGLCLNDLLIEEKLAIAYDGGSKISWANWT